MRKRFLFLAVLFVSLTAFGQTDSLAINEKTYLSILQQAGAMKNQTLLVYRTFTMKRLKTVVCKI